MKKTNRYQDQQASEVHPRYCAHCGFAFHALQRAQQAQYRYCPGCRNPVQWGGHQWANIRVDDQGVIYSDDSSPGFLPVEKPKSKYVEFLARTPGGVVISGIALASLGCGLVLAAVPLATAGAAIAAAGATVLQTAVIGGVLVGLVAAFAGADGKEIGGVLMLGGVVAVGGGAMVLAGSLIIALAGIVGVLGPILVAAGALAVGAVGCHQLYLQNQIHDWTGKAKTALAGKSSKPNSQVGAQNLPGAEDPWAGLDVLKLSENLLEALRKPKHGS